MIIKLTRRGGVERFIEADGLFLQPVSFGRIDLEIDKQGQPAARVLVGEDDEDGIWHRAYVLEKGKTVDTIRGFAPPMTVTATLDGKPHPVKVSPATAEDLAYLKEKPPGQT